MGSYTYTQLSGLTTAELLLHLYNKEDPSDLELELAGRLEQAEDSEAELLELCVKHGVIAHGD